MTATTKNTIQADGSIQGGLNLSSSDTLVVRNYVGDPSTGTIKVQGNTTVAAGGTLQLLLDANTWNSTISFASGSTVSLSDATGNGILDLAFASGVDATSLIGDSFQLFDWTGVTRTGQFDVTNDSSWDLTNLYTTGLVTLESDPTLASSSIVADSSQSSGESLSPVPEPSTLLLLAAGLLTVLSARFCSRKQN